jgi:hypothetical protein
MLHYLTDLRREILFGSVDAEAEGNIGSIVVIVGHFHVPAHTMPRFHRTPDSETRSVPRQCVFPQKRLDDVGILFSTRGTTMQGNEALAFASMYL